MDRRYDQEGRQREGREARLQAEKEENRHAEGAGEGGQEGKALILIIWFIRKYIFNTQTY